MLFLNRSELLQTAQETYGAVPPHESAVDENLGDSGITGAETATSTTMGTA
jgi:hypothetical protein